MSANLSWQPVKNSFRDLESNYVSSDIEKLTSAFRNVLIESDIPKLRAFGEALGNPLYDELADKIEKFGSIELRVTY